MANLKAQLQREAAQAVTALDAAQQPRLTLMAISGPSQYLMGVFGPIGLLMIDSYFITVTKQSVFIHRSPRTTNRPRDLIHVIPLDQTHGLVARVKRGLTWNILFLSLPGKQKATRLNVSRYSRPELEQFLETLAM